MRRLVAVAVAGILLLALAGPASARGAYSVRVFGMAGWTDTFISVASGDVLPISAKGFVQTAPVPAFLTHPATPGSGPAGQTWGGTCADAYPFVDVSVVGPCGVDEAYFGELVARVGNATFRVGDAPAIVVPAGVSGELQLAANDFLFTYFDNGGRFTVTFR